MVLLKQRACSAKTEMVSHTFRPQVMSEFVQVVLYHFSQVVLLSLFYII